MIKNSQPFGEKFQKTVGGIFFLTHTVYSNITNATFAFTWLGLQLESVYLLAFLAPKPPFDHI